MLLVMADGNIDSNVMPAYMKENYSTKSAVVFYVNTVYGFWLLKKLYPNHETTQRKYFESMPNIPLISTCTNPQEANTVVDRVKTVDRGINLIAEAYVNGKLVRASNNEATEVSA